MFARHSKFRTIVLAVLATPCVSMAQNVVERHVDGSRPSCATCTIELEKVASAGVVSDPDLPGFYSAVTIDNQGRILVANRSGSAILLYDSAGRFLKTVGRAGTGPGEFNGIARLQVSSDDSLMVVERLRVSVFSPSLEFVRRAPLVSGHSSLLIFANGQMVIAARLSTPQAAGYPLHFSDSAGGATKPFGTANPELRAECVDCLLRMLTEGRDGNVFWSAHANKYEIEKWSLSLQLRERIIVDRVSWFEPWDTSRAGTTPRRVRPRTQPTGMYEDPSGRLWMVATAPVTRWTADTTPRVSLPPSRGAVRAPSGLPPDPESIKRLATIIEVLEPSSGRLLATRRFDGRNLRLASRNYAYEITENQDGVAVVEVFRMTLRER